MAWGLPLALSAVSQLSRGEAWQGPSSPPMRLREGLQRRTVGHEFFTRTQQFWYEQACDTIWWDLNLLYQSERKDVQKLQKRCHWMTEFHSRVAVDIPVLDGALPFQLLESARGPGPEYLNHNIASSIALYSYYARSIDRCRGPNAMEFFMLSLTNVSACICSYIESAAEGTVELGTGAIVIDRQGQVAGFKACMSQGIHLTVQRLFLSAWQLQFNEGSLVSPLDRDTHSLQDILRFVLTFARRHRTAGKTLSQTCSAKLDTWRRALVAWFSKLADKAVLALCLNCAMSRERAPPAIIFSSRPDKRKYIVMTPEAKWATLDDARAKRTNASTVLALRSASAECGCHPDVVDSWLRKEQTMYSKRTGFALSTGVRHFNLVSDPGHHNYKECLVSVLWCWEVSQAMHCPWQYLVPGKALTPLDFPDMDPELCRYAARHKLERVASFRQIQGYSNQLRVMSRKN